MLYFIILYIVPELVSLSLLFLEQLRKEMCRRSFAHNNVQLSTAATNIIAWHTLFSWSHHFHIKMINSVTDTAQS